MATLDPYVQMKIKFMELAILHCYKTGDSEVANEAHHELAAFLATLARQSAAREAGGVDHATINLMRESILQ
jgi:hypothetical protein